MGVKDDGSDSIAVQVKVYVVCHTSHVTRHTSHITHHTSHVTHHTSHITRHTSCKVAPESHWPELVALVCVVNANKKAVSSTSGMMNRLNEMRANCDTQLRRSLLAAALKPALCSHTALPPSFPTASSAWKPLSCRCGWLSCLHGGCCSAVGGLTFTYIIYVYMYVYSI
jgi:hypothetical protein